ncbi:MAG: hypothetical protein CSA47_01150 [Gammaproteobacteria bacterium]|nr:MAG: hypothetical protein CSA47_01150 [Gammaproteobacteria bacterium]
MSKFIPIEFQKSFQKTQQQAVAIAAHYVQSPEVLQSRFGGYPYWQEGVPIPMDKDGLPVVLLAQINFAEVPKHSELPAKGILQCFMSKADADCDTHSDKKVSGALVAQFWENPCPEKHVDWPSHFGEDHSMPVNGAHALTFSLKNDYAGIETIECAISLQANPFEVLEDVALNEKEEQQFFETISDYVAAEGHKLLGYPYLIEEEPREDDAYRLLLQIDTDTQGDNDIMWDNNGLGQLFIPKQDLQACRFDRIWLHISTES